MLAPVIAPPSPPFKKDKWKSALSRDLALAVAGVLRRARRETCESCNAATRPRMRSRFLPSRPQRWSAYRALRPFEREVNSVAMGSIRSSEADAQATALPR